MKSIKCLFLGHKNKIEQCPVTNAKLVSCDRCGKGSRSDHGTARFS